MQKLEQFSRGCMIYTLKRPKNIFIYLSITLSIWDQPQITSKQNCPKGPSPVPGYRSWTTVIKPVTRDWIWLIGQGLKLVMVLECGMDFGVQGLTRLTVGRVKPLLDLHRCLGHIYIRHMIVTLLVPKLEIMQKFEQFRRGCVIHTLIKDLKIHSST